MTDVAKLIADMARAGVDPELIGRAAAALAEREPVFVTDEQAERKRAADRERMRAKRSAMSRDIGDKSDNPGLSSPEVFPQTPFPKPLQSIPPSAPKGASSPAGWSEFWALYPNKVGKADAMKKFAAALRIAPFETIMAGLRRYVAKTDDRMWCNPATWLFQQRWDDQPAEVARGSPTPSKAPSQADVFQFIGRNLTNDPGPEHDDSGSPRQAIPHLSAI